MNKPNDSLSMLELAELFIREKNENTLLQDIINYIFEVKGFQLNDFQKLNAFYLDLTHSAKFVFCGDNYWNLKENNLELWDKEGFAYVGDVDASEEDVEEDIEFTDFNIDDISLPSEEELLVEEDNDDEEDIDIIEDEDEIEAILEEKEYIDVEISMKSTDEDDGDDVELDFDDDFDDEDYNEIMDDYEDMYDED
jgi:DNA-directed RNA polymerase subunit delta